MSISQWTARCSEAWAKSERVFNGKDGDTTAMAATSGDTTGRHTTHGRPRIPTPVGIGVNNGNKKTPPAAIWRLLIVKGQRTG